MHYIKAHKTQRKPYNATKYTMLVSRPAAEITAASKCISSRFVFVAFIFNISF